MILGIIIRNFKIYKNINFIPLSNGTNFCGLIGQNGIGKSSILEALDCFFNNKNWNKNLDAGTQESYVTPIILIEKSFFRDCDEEKIEFIEKYSSAVIDFLKNDISPTINQLRKQCFEEMKRHYCNIDFTNKYLLPINLTEHHTVDFGIFDENDILNNVKEIGSLPQEYAQLQEGDKYKKENELKDKRNNELKEKLGLIYNLIINRITYVYVPKDIEPERFVKFETEEMQHLIGSDLMDIVKKQLTEQQIKDISMNLKLFVEKLSEKLLGYKFKIKDRERQANLKSKEIYDLIIQDFFTKRELHKENSGKDIPLANLSSGEKQQAILSLIYSLVAKYRKKNDNLIIAVDEPESALHISLCYDQFEKLSDISDKCCQVLYASHWYGFIPTITKGVIVDIVRENTKHVGYLFDVYKYREEIKIANRISRLPIEISLKGINDLIQSIISSVIRKENAYNWLVCEGSSDKIYLDEYLKTCIENEKLRIVPVGGVGEVEKIYNQLCFSFKELKSELRGKVFMLIDTDTDLHDFNTSTPQDIVSHLACKRLVNDNCSKSTKLVQNQSNPKSPKTDIEDALNGKAFYRTLKKIENDSLDFIDTTLNDKEEMPSYYSMNLGPLDYEKLDAFFSKNNNQNKVLFAKKYVEEIQIDQFKIPEWIEEIKNFYVNK